MNTTMQSSNPASSLKQQFRNAMKMVRTDPMLAESVRRSSAGTKVYWADEYPLRSTHLTGKGTICVTKETTLQAALRLRREHPEQKMALLNFGGCRHRGGGVARGARGQEEDLCRSSTLYPVLHSHQAAPYYQWHREHYTPEASDALIYSKDIWIWDSSLRFGGQTDVITMAAPNLSHGYPMSSEELYRCHRKRARHMLAVAAGNGVEILVLGAFGCGAYKNDPAIVARAMKDALEEFRDVFRVVDFAIPGGPGHMGRYCCFRNQMAGNTGR